MGDQSFEVRICNSCGLRYPLTHGHSFGIRCPHCLGETRIVLEKKINKEIGTREKETPNTGSKLNVLVDNVRSAWNVGSILRSADGFGFAHVYLCGITPTPEEEAVQKTSLGSEDYVTWSYHKDAVKLVKGLKKEGWKILTLEEDEKAISIQSIRKSDSENVVLIVGNEITGVDPELLDTSDMIVYIPMYGKKRSFNVATAFGVAANHLSRLTIS